MQKWYVASYLVKNFPTSVSSCRLHGIAAGVSFVTILGEGGGMRCHTELRAIKDELLMMLLLLLLLLLVFFFVP